VACWAGAAYLCGRGVGPLEISGYQFPEHEAGGQRDYDANWLIVRGEVVLAGGDSWSFEDPCLTTWDAADLGAWLRDVSAGEIAPCLPDDDASGQMLVFLEPNLGFQVESRTGDQVRVRVHFSLESLSPWLRNTRDQPEPTSTTWRSTFPAADLASAARAWLADTGSYPER
jgi:hypothetical protein